ncbi:hypothetical protein EYC80_004961 [Monilinia laxa]|uniref:Uncharacterized protein n=1 Tax=Monilinia laxa TaxID=61186 RepID=A0A5N6KIF5_MONLA|nr:hypothetical protein EYC80_004961 [Monilinia laxa]
MLSFTKPNFKLRRINQSLASNPVTTPPRNTVGSERILSPGAVVDKQEVRRVTEENWVSQETSDFAPKCLNKIDNQIQGGATGTKGRSGIAGRSYVAFPVMPNRAIELERYMKKDPHKDWISRFINMQRTNKSARSKEDTRKRPFSGWGFASRKAEYLKLGLELSYEDVKAADWKLQNLTSSGSKMRRARKARPGKSNLRKGVSGSLHLSKMPTNPTDEEDWMPRELEIPSQLIETDELVMRREQSLSDVSNLVNRPVSARNFHDTSPFSQLAPEDSLGVSELPLLQDSMAQSDSSPQPIDLKLGEDLEECHRFDLNILENTLKETLDTTRGDDKESADNYTITEELSDNEQDSVLKVTFLDVSEEEHGNAEENLSEEDYFSHHEALQIEIPDDPNSSAAEEAEDEKPLFGKDLFENPLQALEYQENELDSHLTEPSMPAMPEITRRLFSKTLLTRFMAGKPQSRRRMPNGPGEFNEWSTTNNKRY